LVADVSINDDGTFLLEAKSMRSLIVLGSALCLVLVSAVVLAQGGFKRINELLTGYQEVPAVSTQGEGEFHARISNDELQIQYELTYSNLEGTVQQAHIHFGQKGVNGGISVFLCTNLGNGPPGTQTCPLTSPATISGTIRAADVIGPGAQGLAAGELRELITAMRAGATYVNIHSTTWPGGEVRSQIDGNSGR
jgi:hypothetical protein